MARQAPKRESTLAIASAPTRHAAHGGHGPLLDLLSSSLDLVLGLLSSSSLDLV